MTETIQDRIIRERKEAYIDGYMQCYRMIENQEYYLDEKMKKKLILNVFKHAEDSFEANHLNGRNKKS